MAASGNYRLLSRFVAAVVCAVASAAACTSPVTSAAAPGTVPAGDPAGLTDPLVGTSADGNTFPGATLPFGMARPSPDTPSRPPGGGYAYDDSKILGFSTVHVSGPGCPALGDISVMPVTGPVTSTGDTGYASAFSRATETARPGYYGVTLIRYGVRAELTATERTAWERYTFPPAARTPAEVLVNLGAAENKTTAARLAVTGPDTVTGSQSTRSSAEPDTGRSPSTSPRGSGRPFAATGTWDNGPVAWGSTSVRGTAVGAALRFAPGARQVVAAIGVSYTSAAEAAANLAAETPASGGFAAVAREAHATWERWLGRAAVTGGTREQRATFYTALYHSLLEPNVFSDSDGEYLGMDGKIHTAKSRIEYTNLSLWDTYRTQQELLDLIAPGVARDIALSLISDTRELGWVPRWVLANEETNTMSGDSVAEMFADALAAGVVTKAEVSAIYPYLKDNATKPPPPGSNATGRAGVTDYGRTATSRSPPLARTSSARPPRRRSNTPSRTADCGLRTADCGLSHVAAALGQRADAAGFAATAQDYRAEFDPSTGFFRPRLAGGSFLSPFDPSFVSLPYMTGDVAGFDEGSAWQYLWLVPQDPVGLARLLGGTDAMIGDLDTFFAFDRVAADPAAAASAWSNGARYSAGDEVDFEAPYTYDALGAAWRTQAVVRAALTVYRPAPGGLPGNDDLGEMSAWYVMSALGLYPYAAGQGVFTLSAPLFGRVVIRPASPSAGAGFAARRPVVISNPGAGTYIDALTVNGRPRDAAWISGSLLADGATLAYRTGAKPDPRWASGPGGAPPAFCAG
jgi:predicted alpha-1,2-mannosidase